ncbi:SRPBCC family protein [Pseudonocardia sp. CA-107938]|uniref:SRPBCC family protein n=1 Tax=Pseudonocardia sp. CA-107938 TaxID=3240021 RepID=UPI003D8D7BFD
MTEVAQVIAAPPMEVFAVLGDGWTYPLWVVGASHMRKVDPEWPAVGARLHHSVGSWPMLIEDTTEVVELDPGRRLVLAARAWPFGRARVEIVLEPHTDGTCVRMRETVVAGPARLIPGPVEAALLRLRNRESLQRLAAVVCRERV